MLPTSISNQRSFRSCDSLSNVDFQTKIGEGGLVPKSLYLSESELEKEGFSLGENSIYNSFTLHRGQVGDRGELNFDVNRILPKIVRGISQVFEIIVNVQESGTVITWDFDVMRHDVMFTVYKINQQVDMKDGPISSPGT